MMDRSVDRKPACHAKGEVASDWIALRYAYTNLSRGGCDRRQADNLFALILLPQFERGEAEEDVAEIREVSDRAGLAD